METLFDLDRLEWERGNTGDVVMHVTRLTPEEDVWIDPDRLAELYVQLGQQGAEDMVCSVMEEIAVRLAKTGPLFQAGEITGLRKLCRSLVAVADQIGLKALAQVAGDVADCAAGNDPVALSATLSRLRRVGDQSVTAVWDTNDLSG